MHLTHLTRRWLWLLPALLLVVSLGVGFTALTAAHAAGPLVVTNCTSDTQLQNDVTQANTDNANDTITFQCGGSAAIKLTSTLTISGSMTIDGGQAITLDGQGTHQIFNVNLSSGTLTLKSLTLTNGVAIGNDPFNPGIVTGGAINNTGSGTVNITNSTLTNNSVQNAPGSLDALYGGAIYNAWGIVNIINSTLASNSVGVGGEGGAIENSGTLSITNSTLAYNFTGKGGEGGALWSNGTVTITNSTLAYNSASRQGGAIVNAATMSSFGSIIADSTSGGDCGNYIGINDKGYNLSDDSSCGFTGTGSLQATNPLLASALANNGGPTQTIALQQGSPANDRIPVASCPSTDQRGVSRPDTGESTCDVGAYEFVDPTDNDLGLAGVPANSTVDATSPQGATVTYSAPTATDESGDTSSASVNCTPVSGSTFAIGTTTVTCTATDSDDTNSPVSAHFTVTVNGAATQTSNQITTIQSFHLPSNGATSFISQLQAVQADMSANNTAQACSDLTGFINHVQAPSGKKLTTSQANQLITGAKRIQAVLGC